MASHVPLHLVRDGKGYDTTLYSLLWRPEEIGEDFQNTDDMGEALLKGVFYMMRNRRELLKYESPNGWGTYKGFMKFLLNLLQACQDNPGCRTESYR